MGGALLRPASRMTAGLASALALGVLASAFFAASEGAFSGRTGPLGPPPERLRHAIAVGHLAAVAWTAALAYLALDGYLAGGAPWWAAAALVAMVAFVLHVAGEQVPAALGHARARAWNRVARLPLAVWSAALLPVTFFASRLALLVGRVVGPPRLRREPITSRDVQSMVAETSAKIEDEERQMITSIFAFGETTAREIMTPRTDVFALEVATPVGEAIRRVREAEHSRVPVVGRDLDDVVGFLHARDLLAIAHGIAPEPASLDGLVREAAFVPEGKKIDDLLREVQGGPPLAVVVDEYGGTAGIVTLEDILEEMVGEIQDEYDQEPPLVVPLPDGSLGVDGRLDADDFNDLTESDLESQGGAETIGGLVARELGRVPHGGETVKIGGWVFHVEAVEAKRVTRIRARRDKGVSS